MKVHPVAYMSVAAVLVVLSMSSGARYRREPPNSEDVYPVGPPSSARDNPKSQRAALPSALIRMFA